MNSRNLFSNKRKYVNTSETVFSPSFKRFKRVAPVDYENWDDPNELVDRLSLLVAEQSAGNLIHFLKIQTILKELYEAGYIY